jgi:DMSO/TMAO reductase YedYZ heme-binding membrane subunit
MLSHTWWYIARASGIVAWLTLTASILWGIVLSTRAFPKHRRPAWLLDLHRWLGVLTLALVALHIGAILADSYTPIVLVDVMVPFTSPWRPLAVALGVISTWALVTVHVTSLAMRRMPRRTWHAIHLASYGTFVLGTLHAVLAGSDRASVLYQSTGLVALVVTGWAAGYRLTHQRHPRLPSTSSEPAAAVPSTGHAVGVPRTWTEI